MRPMPRHQIERESWAAQFGLSPAPDKANEFHDETMLNDAHNAAHFCMCGPGKGGDSFFRFEPQGIGSSRGGK